MPQPDDATATNSPVLDAQEVEINPPQPQKPQVHLNFVYGQNLASLESGSESRATRTIFDPDARDALAFELWHPGHEIPCTENTYDLILESRRDPEACFDILNLQVIELTLFVNFHMMDALEFDDYRHRHHVELLFESAFFIRFLNRDILTDTFVPEVDTAGFLKTASRSASFLLTSISSVKSTSLASDAKAVLFLSNLSDRLEMEFYLIRIRNVNAHPVDEFAQLHTLSSPHPLPIIVACSSAAPAWEDSLSFHQTLTLSILPSGRAMPSQRLPTASPYPAPAPIGTSPVPSPVSFSNAIACWRSPSIITQPPSKQASNTADTQRSQSNSASLRALGTAFAVHTNPLWAESTAQAQEWSQVAGARASEVVVQAQENLEGQHLHGRRRDGSHVDITRVESTNPTKKRMRDTDAALAAEEKSKPVHEESPHKKVKASSEGKVQLPALALVPSATPSVTIGTGTNGAKRTSTLQMTETEHSEGNAELSEENDEGSDGDSIDIELSENETESSKVDTESSDVETLVVFRPIEARECRSEERGKEVRGRTLWKNLGNLRRGDEKVKQAGRVRQEGEVARIGKAVEKEDKLRKEKGKSLLETMEQRLENEVQACKKEKLPPVKQEAMKPKGRLATFVGKTTTKSTTHIEPGPETKPRLGPQTLTKCTSQEVKKLTAEKHRKTEAMENRCQNELYIPLRAQDAMLKSHQEALLLDQKVMDADVKRNTKGTEKQVSEPLTGNPGSSRPPCQWCGKRGILCIWDGCGRAKACRKCRKDKRKCVVGDVAEGSRVNTKTERIAGKSSKQRRVEPSVPDGSREGEGCAPNVVDIGRIASITSENALLELKRIDELIQEVLQLERAIGKNLLHIQTNMRNKDKALRQALSIVEASGLNKGPARNPEKGKDKAVDNEELEIYTEM
ncbi:hypothetical protein JB92DRAFT_3145662 [Gautieria morchelliformis]|nr:hypothetical protein JB92DRAFT_3145662 [Gautieria morchelliformis]